MKKEQKETIIKLKHSAFLIDIVAILVLATSVFLEAKDAIYVPFSYHISVDIIISLIPAIITIITVAMQMQTANTIRGIPLHEFERLRKRFYFSLLHMSLIFITVFSLETLFLFFELRFCILVLDFLSIIYSIVFLIQEMPVLSKNEKVIDSVLSKIVVGGTNDQIQDSYGRQAIKYTLMKYGIEDSLRRLSSRKTDKSDLLKTFLRIQVSYYNEVLNRTGEQIIRDDKLINNIDILKAIESSYDDLVYLLVSDDPAIVKLLSENSDFYYLTRITWAIKTITDQIGYSMWNDKKTKNLINILNIRIYGKNPNEYPLIFRYLLLMSIYSITNGKKWFVEAVRDVDFSPLLFDVIETPLSFLLTMYMCFFVNSGMAKKEYKDLINNFVDEQSKGINSMGYQWRRKVKSSLRDNLSGTHFLSGVIRMLQLKNLLDDVYYEIRPEFGGPYTIDDSSFFGKELFFDYCIQILVSNYFYDINESGIEHFLSEMSPDDKDIFLRTFEARWKDVEKRKNGYAFYKFVYNTNTDIELKNNTVYLLLRSYTSKIRKDEYDHDPSGKIDEEKIKNIKEQLDSKIGEIFSSVPFKTDDIDDSGSQKRFLYLYLDIIDYSELLNLYLNNFKYHIYKIIKDKVAKESESIKHNLSNSNYEERMIQSIVTFGPDYFYNSYKYEILASKNQIPEGIKPKRLEEAILPRDTFIKEGAVKTKFEFVKDESIPRVLKDDEIEEMIDRDFTMINGYYRFSKYKGTDNGYFFVTRDELAKYLSERTVLVPIVFKCNVEVDKTNVLSFSFDKDEEDFD